jgi:hydrogenase expression/formation protein HypC
MCLAVPGRVVAWINRDPLFAMAEVEFEGLRRPCHMACVPEALPGQYVIVHAGVAISLVDEAAARKTLQDLRACGEEPVGDQAIIPGDGGQSFSVSSDTP